MNRTGYIVIGVGLVIVLVLAITLPIVLTGKDDDDEQPPMTRRERAIALMQDTPLIDGHNDLPWQIQKHYFNRFENVTLDKGMPNLHTDIPRLKKGKVGAQFWAAYVTCGLQYKDAVRKTIEQIDVIHRLTETYPEALKFVTSARGIEEAFEQGKVGSLIGVEGGHSIDSSLDILRAMYDLGARYMTLTHACHTPWADSCSPKVPEHNGLTEFGKIMVKEMNRLGIFVDLSHVSAKTMHDALDVTKAPVIFSHSSAFALCNNSRNVPDDVLKRMPNNGGVVMVNFYNDFVTCSKDATLDDVADHIDHIKKVAGIDHVGLGGDYDGVPRVPVGLEDVSTYPNLIEELLRRGYSDDDIRKVIGKNLLRAMKTMEKVASDQSDLQPFDNYISVDNDCRASYAL